MAFISQNNDVLLTKLGVIGEKMENCEETVESWKEDFDTQDQFEIINNEINEIKKLPLVHMIDHMSNLENKIEEEREWAEQNFDYLEKKCQKDLIQTQSDIISNTNEMTKVIENQMMVNEKIKCIQDFTENKIDSIKNMMNLSVEDSVKSIAANNDESNREQMKFIENSLESFRTEFNEIQKVTETMKKSANQANGDIVCLTNDK